MRIGILTYQRAENYGAMLQAYALKTYLEGLGHDVSFVDYWPEYHEDYFRIFSRYKFREGGMLTKLYCIYMMVVWGVARNKRKKVFRSFMSNFLGLSPCPEFRLSDDVCSKFELVVYGSDQIWRKQNLPGHRDRDEWYFGSDNILSKKIAYAASAGNIPWEDESAAIESLKKFEAISVREESLKDYLSQKGLSASLVSDPVFLLSATHWKSLASTAVLSRSYPKRYIFFYNLLNSSESSSFTNELSKKYHLPIVEITKVYSFSKLGSRYVRNASVPEFLSLIDGAEFVVSNSFHGVAISILFKKQFYAVGMGEKADRVCSLLNILGLRDRFFTGSLPLGEKSISYQHIESLLEEYISDSQSFLNETLNEEK